MVVRLPRLGEVTPVARQGLTDLLARRDGEEGVRLPGGTRLVGLVEALDTVEVPAVDDLEGQHQVGRVHGHDVEGDPVAAGRQRQETLEQQQPEQAVLRQVAVEDQDALVGDAAEDRLRDRRHVAPRLGVDHLRTAADHLDLLPRLDVQDGRDQGEARFVVVAPRFELGAAEAPPQVGVRQQPRDERADRLGRLLAGGRAALPTAEREDAFVVRMLREQARVLDPDLARRVLVTQRQDPRRAGRQVGRGDQRPLRVLARLIGRARRQMEAAAASAVDAGDPVLMQVAAERHVGVGLEQGADVRALVVVQPGERVVVQGNRQLRVALRPQAGDRPLQPPPSDPEQAVVRFIRGEDRRVDRQDRDPVARDLDQAWLRAGGDRRAPAVPREVAVVPFDETPELGEVRAGVIGTEELARLDLVGERPGEPLARPAIYVVVARDDEEPPFVDPRGLDEAVEDRADRRVLDRLAAECQVAGDEHQVETPPPGAQALDGADQRVQDELLLVGWALLDVEVGDVEPAEHRGRGLPRGYHGGQGGRRGTPLTPPATSPPDRPAPPGGPAASLPPPPPR